MVADLFSLLAQTASPKGKPGKNERQPWRWIGQSGEKVGAAVGADLFSLLAQTASPKGEAEIGRIVQSASTERKAEKGTKDSRGVGKGKGGERLVRRLEQTSSVCLRRQLPRRGKPRKKERFRGVRA